VIVESAAPALLAFVLGARHGLDADHLAAIDGLTRWNASAGRRGAPLCGVLFSAGHAGVIIATALALAALASQFTPPAWLAPVGTAISATTLIALGWINLRSACAGAGISIGAGAPVGLRVRFMGPVLRASGAWQVALVGALFALSFDAVAIAALFASSASGVAGILQAGFSFAAGMLAVGAANGLWVMRLLRHSGDASRRAARVMTLTIAVIAFAVAARVLLPLVSAQWDRWVEGYELVVSGSVVTLVLAGYFTSLGVASRLRSAQGTRTAATPDILG
jgi:high-affinity nickel-transport protein